MKKIISLISCLALTLLFLGIIPLKTTVKAHASGEYQNYLISPASIVATEEHIFIADSWTNEIILYDLTSKERLSSVNLSGVKQLKISGDKLYALATTNVDNETAIFTYNLSLQNQTKLSFPISYLANGSPIDFVVLNDEIKVLKTDGNLNATIDSFTIEEASLVQKPFESATISSFNFNAAIKDLISMNIHTTEIIVIFKTGVFAYDTSTYQSRTIFTPTENTYITQSSEDYVILSNGKIIQLESGEVVATSLKTCSGIANVGNKVYIANKDSHQILGLDSGTLIDLSLNPDISPTLFNAKNFKHIKLTSSALLKLKPYSVEANRSVEAGKHLTIVGELENYYYCLYVGEENEFLYLDKSTNNFEEIEIGSVSTSYVVIVNSYIRKFPSSKQNSNPAIGENQIHASETIIVKNSTIIKNNREELFYLVEYNGEFGFIKYSAVQSTRGQYTLTTPCNAKIKRATTLFENADGTGEIIALLKGTRIAMQEETAPTKDYIKIEYQDENGIIYSGYVLSDDIDPDGLSTLQILGLILVGTNLALLITILVIKRNSKKWKV